MMKKKKETEKTLLFEKVVIVSLGKKELMKIKGGGQQDKVAIGDAGSGDFTCDQNKTG